MNRHALIIASPGESEEDDFLPGVRRDREHYKSYLISPFGGAWYDHEIDVLTNPTTREVRGAIEELEQADYSMTIFSGHACFDADIGEHRIAISDGHEISDTMLRQGARRHTLILDCCRVVVESQLSERQMQKREIAKAYADPEEHRIYFNKSIRQCPSGLSVLYACARGETAGDDPDSGGVYSSSLIDLARVWRDSEVRDTRETAYPLSIVEAHALARDRVRARSGGRQNPRMEKPKTGPYFPFGIVA